jgi:hypothetical protein
VTKTKLDTIIKDYDSGLLIILKEEKVKTIKAIKMRFSATLNLLFTGLTAAHQAVRGPRNIDADGARSAYSKLLPPGPPSGDTQPHPFKNTTGTDGGPKRETAAVSVGTTRYCCEGSASDLTDVVSWNGATTCHDYYDWCDPGVWYWCYSACVLQERHVASKVQ